MLCVVIRNVICVVNDAVIDTAVGFFIEAIALTFIIASQLPVSAIITCILLFVFLPTAQAQDDLTAETYQHCHPKNP